MSRMRAKTVKDTCCHRSRLGVQLANQTTLAHSERSSHGNQFSEA
jgi:hypothetical protein